MSNVVKSEAQSAVEMKRKTQRRQVVTAIHVIPLECYMDAS
jgi:hypothetical protein